MILIGGGEGVASFFSSSYSYRDRRLRERERKGKKKKKFAYSGHGQERREEDRGRVSAEEREEAFLSLYHMKNETEEEIRQYD